jgi:hypothetical protein
MASSEEIRYRPTTAEEKNNFQHVLLQSISERLALAHITGMPHSDIDCPLCLYVKHEGKSPTQQALEFAYELGHKHGYNHAIDEGN